MPTVQTLSVDPGVELDVAHSWYCSHSFPYHLGVYGKTELGEFHQGAPVVAFPHPWNRRFSAFPFKNLPLNAGSRFRQGMVCERSDFEFS